ncbi:unnamed protein product [Closterium sp. NIES-53]
MQLETVQFCWERDGFDPQEFFRKMAETLAGEAETYYRMMRGEILEELDCGEKENLTQRFLQLLRREFTGQTRARVEDFKEFKRKKEESLLAYYYRLRELVEDMECKDERLLVWKFVRVEEEGLRSVLRTAIYGIG